MAHNKMIATKTNCTRFREEPVKLDSPPFNKPNKTLFVEHDSATVINKGMISIYMILQSPSRIILI